MKVYEVGISVGALPVSVRTRDAAFAQLLEQRYADFLHSESDPKFKFDIELAQPSGLDPDADVQVRREGGEWTLQRGDFHAQWRPEEGTGRIQQTANPYAIDAVLRIVHTLLLAQEGGFLLHAASAVREGKAYVFTGQSGAGKTTLSRMAPPDVHLLTDEVSYLRKMDNGYRAYGTPFAGELGKPGENISSPLTSVNVLVQGKENRLEKLTPNDALRALMRNILFFAEEEASVKRVFESAYEFVQQVPVYRMTFLKDPSAWQLIGGEAVRA